MTPPAGCRRRAGTGATTARRPRRTALGRAVATLPLLATVAAPLRAQAPALTAPVEVTAVEFVGAASFDEAVLRASVVTAATRCAGILPLCLLGVGVQEGYLAPVQLPMDRARLELFYYQRGFRESTVAVDTLRDGDGVRVRFTIEEGRPVLVSAVEVTGTEGLEAPPATTLPLVAGQPLDFLAYEASRDSLTARLRERGFARAQVFANYTIPTDARYTASVRYELVPDERMRFGAVQVEGASRVQPGVVRRMLTFGAGDRFSPSALLRSQRNLFGLDIFQHAEIVTDAGSWPDTLVAVTVRVNEGNLYRVRVGMGANTSEYLTAEGRWTARNFLGGARRLEVGGRVTNLLAQPLGLVPGIFEETGGIYGRPAGSLSLDFSQPWFFAPVNTLGLGVFAERRSIPDVFVRQALGAYVRFTRALGADGTLSLGYRPELTEIDSEGDLIYCLGFTACGEDEIAVLREPHWLAPLTASWARDRANSIFAPTPWARAAPGG